MQSRLAAIIAFMSLLLFGLSAPAWAQRTTATFAGIVVDTSGGILPGADVALANQETGIVERQVTSLIGEFVFNYVPGGSYTLTISITGFKTYTAKGISLGAAQSVRRSFEMEVGAMEESVTVSGEAPLINTTSPEQRINLEPLEVRSLPATNRNISNILNVGAGLTKQEGVEGGGTVRLRLNGLGGGSMNITADGTAASGNSGSRTLSSYNAVSKIDVMSMEAVAEVQIVKGIVPAEYGQAMGGNINITSKSGANNWHGSLFHRYDGAALSAKQPLLASKPDSTWNQYGGSLGGPIARDRAFFFAAFEGYRQDTSIPLNTNVPTQRFRDLALAALPFAETKLFLDLYPLPNQTVDSTALTGGWIGPGGKTNEDDHVDVRTDYRIKGGNLSTTFAAGHPSLAQANVVPERLRVWETRNWRASASYSVARGRWSSETRFGGKYNWLSRTDAVFHLTDPAKPAGNPDHRGVPRISFPGLASAGDSEQFIHGLAPSYSFEQQATIVTDKHAFKFGGIFLLHNGGRINLAAPNVSFQTLDDLLANRPSQIAYTFGNTEAVWKATNFGFFVQDNWRVNPSLVINLGIRYDYFGRFRVYPGDPNNPAGLINLDGLLDRNFNFGPPRDPDRIVEADMGINLGPRIGFAYNRGGTGKTVVSGGWGMMFQPLDPQTYEPSIGSLKVPRNRTFSASEAAAGGLRYPVYSEDMARQLAAATGGPPSVSSLFDPHIQAPYAMVFTVGVQRALGSSMALDASYVGTRGLKFPMQRTYNQPDRLTGIRPNPNLSEERYWDNAQETRYHSLQTSLRQRVTRHLTFNLNYTWSKALAHIGGDISQGFIGDSTANVQDFFDYQHEWGPAAGDVTHLYIGSVIYEVPSDRFSSRLGKHLIGGWQVAGIFKAQTGVPLLVTQTSTRGGSRPDFLDFATAVNKECCSTGHLQYLNREAFSLVPVSAVSRATIRRGNVGNGAVRGPGLRNLDLSLVKSFSVGGPRRVELRADMLNMLNLTNYTSIQTNISSGNFGQATGTASARVIQVQVRFSF